MHAYPKIIHFLLIILALVPLEAGIEDFECNRDLEWHRKKGSAESYYADRSKCEWTSHVAQEYLEDAHFEYSKNTHEYAKKHADFSFTFKNSVYRDLEVKTCNIKESEVQGLRIERIGPFVGMGGYDWQGGSYNNVLKLREVQEEYRKTHPGARMHIITKALVPVWDGNFTIMPNPPIHIHHTHAYADKWQSMGYSDRFLQTHGDGAVCNEEDGGVDCMIEDWRDSGYGVPVVGSDEMSLDFELNDNRPHGEAAIVYWFEVAMRYTFTEDIKPQMVSLYHAGMAYPDNVKKYPGMKRLGVVYAEPDVASAHWYTFRWGKTRGELSDLLWHAHQHGDLHSMYLFKDAVPEDIGLNKGKWQLPGPARFIRLPDVGEDIASFEKHLWDKGARKLMCHSYAETASHQGYGWPEEEAFDRRMPICCRPEKWMVEKDSYNTIVSLFKGERGGARDDMNTHLSLWTYFKTNGYEQKDGAVVTFMVGGAYKGAECGFDSTYDFDSTWQHLYALRKCFFGLTTTGEGPWHTYFPIPFWKYFFLPVIMFRWSVLFCITLMVMYGPDWVVLCCGGWIPCCCCVRSTDRYKDLRKKGKEMIEFSELSTGETKSIKDISEKL